MSERRQIDAARQRSTHLKCTTSTRGVMSTSKHCPASSVHRRIIATLILLLCVMHASPDQQSEVIMSPTCVSKLVCARVCVDVQCKWRIEIHQRQPNRVRWKNTNPSYCSTTAATRRQAIVRSVLMRRVSVVRPVLRSFCDSTRCAARAVITIRLYRRRLQQLHKRRQILHPASLSQ